MKEGYAMTIELANRLYELRKAHELSQDELAEKLGVSRQAVSKWERSEASPDTDNIISLAKIYGLSLDELIYGAKEDNKKTEEKETKCEDKKTGTVDIGPTGIFVESKDGDKVQINLRGIKVTEGKHIHISSDGDDDDDDFDDDDDDDEGVGKKRTVIVDENGNVTISVNKRERKKAKPWIEIPYAIICVIAYLIFGFYNIWGGWALSWIIFITIPIYYSLIEAIYIRKFTVFAYPVLTAFLYLYMGLYRGNWHPSWIIFITIPVYYSIAEAIDKKIKARKESDQ